MTDVNFYQLASKPLDAVLPRLLDKAVAAGFRTVIRSVDTALLARLDAALWTYDPAAFLPHGVDGEVLIDERDDIREDCREWWHRQRYPELPSRDLRHRLRDFRNLIHAGSSR